jgi:hypothetical protein
MYSYGSSTRVGVGKRGHGGRNYRPPPDRKNNGDLVPPPLKACSCLLQLDIPEYMKECDVQGTESDNEHATSTVNSLERRRTHMCFPGETIEERRKSMQHLSKRIRSKFGVHLQIPGRAQRGPVAIVGKSYRDAIPATAWFLQKLVLPLDGDDVNSVVHVTGRIQRNIKDPNDVVLEGKWRPTSLQGLQEVENTHLQPFWLFQSDVWSVMACDLLTATKSGPSSPCVADASEPKDILGSLQICLDNFQFQIGSHGLHGLDIFLHNLFDNDTKAKGNDGSKTKHPAWSMAFAAGHPEKVNPLFQEIRQIAIRL